MKYFITIFTALFILSSCKKNEVPQPQPQAGDTLNNPGIAFKKAFDHLDKEAMKHHKGAIEALVTLPEGGPIPPHLLPAIDLKLLTETDSTALYSFTSGPNKINTPAGTVGTKVKIGLKRMIRGTDTIWNMSSIEESHR